jgi:hypothetical protein
MIEKIKWQRMPFISNGYWKPSGKWAKRNIHKKARRMNNLDTNRRGIYNRIGVYFDWC